MSVPDEEVLRDWLALYFAPGVGAVGFRRLLEQAGSPTRLCQQPALCKGLDSRLRTYLNKPDWAAVDRSLAWARGKQCHILTLADPRYPALLAEIGDPPPLLFVRGSIEALANPQLAMVGSRNPSPLGRESAEAFARHLARAGLGICSGLALGIDAASHEGCLAGGGQTVAVSGTGLDRVYPARHRDLAHAIVEHGGALVSEFAPDTPPLPGNFPKRNRIISGLSLGTLVVEAALRSGSLITARSALEQGREVFAIPGSIHNPLARGCHRLIREGAKLVETAGDILEELAPQLRGLLAAAHEVQASAPTEAVLDAEYRQLLAYVGYEPTSVDTLVARSGLTAEAVSSMLLLLELEDYVASTDGGYLRTSKRTCDETERI